ncbi:MAG: Na+/H+ antiporter subunit E [Chromatocurvus sp.]
MAAVFGLSVTGMIRQALVLGGLWLILTGADHGSLMVGVPAVLLSVCLSGWLGLGTRTSLVRLLQFLPVFLLRSVVAAFDVARRTFAPRLAISPALVSYDIALPHGLPRVFFMNTISLLPGTLSAALEGDRLTVHVLDRGRDHAAELARLENTVARIFPQVSRD